ncbi:MAG: helix-turn-helix domain-containing protein [Polyangiales bacterium]
MPRPRDPERFGHLVATAVEVFIERGYSQTQVGHIAEAMGVAKGTIYLYVESKEALFDLAIRGARGDLEPHAALPVPTPEPEATLRYVRDAIAVDLRLPRLEAALQQPRTDDPRSELTEIVRELYQLVSRHRVALKLVDRSATEYPDLAAIFFDMARQAIPQLLLQYLESRLPKDHALPLPALARGIVEIVAFWALHHHWDPAPTPVSERESEDAAVLLALGALGP